MMRFLLLSSLFASALTTILPAERVLVQQIRKVFRTTLLTTLKTRHDQPVRSRRARPHEAGSRLLNPSIHGPNSHQLRQCPTERRPGAPQLRLQQRPHGLQLPRHGRSDHRVGNVCE